ncbi:iron chelate uptake ABC transporter family permease subunit, partial [Streptomyces avidinii]
MLVESPPEPERSAAPPEGAVAAVARPRHAARAVGLLAALAVLALIAVVSIAVGAKQMSLDEVWHGLFAYAGTPADVVVRDLRIPRTLLGLMVGLGLGLSGAVMQALTRNPLAEPGILGVNAGAAAAVVSAISFFGASSLSEFVWWAFLGAAAVSVVVYMLGGSRSATPVRLALAGTAASAALVGYINAVQLMDTKALDKLRFWTVGSLASANMDTVRQVAPFLLVGAVLALALGRPLNAMAMGDDTARALGAHLTRTRVGAMIAITLLCGAA